MKRFLILFVVLTFSGCLSTYARVVQADDIAQARKLLKGDEPSSITTYPPNGEAWYFGKNECVLFMDGKKVLSISSVTTAEQGHVLPSQTKAVLCSPSEATQKAPHDPID